MTRAPPLSGRGHIFVTFAAAVSLWRFSVCAFVGLRIEGSMNACMELVGFSTSNKVKNHCSSHFRPSPADVLHSHTVTKQGRCWNAHFQLRWLNQFPWLSYSNELKGGICRYCILFPE